MVRNAISSDLEAILKVYEIARQYMKDTGNPTQWGDDYPTVEAICEHMTNGDMYVVERNDKICGAFAYIVGEEHCYNKIEGGWLFEEEYGTIHMMAANGIEKAVFAEALEFSKGICPHVRIDTHPNNKTMQHLILKHGFEYCGIIYVSDGSPRYAYEQIFYQGGQL